jgi:ABC-type multidrug transport system ATPase subunit
MQTVKKGNTVILTTHSMEEAESVCNKIGIMVNGQLRCLGSSQHLKSRNGGAYRLTVSLENHNDPQGRIRIESAFGGSLQLIEGYGGTFTWELSQYNSIADVLELLQHEKKQLGISSYALYQVSLEQVFLHHAQQQTTDNEQISE